MCVTKADGLNEKKQKEMRDASVCVCAWVCSASYCITGVARVMHLVLSFSGSEGQIVFIGLFLA